MDADKAYDFRRCRIACKVRGILSRIAWRGVETAEKLGKHRWVVERTFAWFRHFKRLTVRYERRAVIHLAFLKLAACMICYSALGRLPFIPFHPRASPCIPGQFHPWACRKQVTGRP